MPDPDPLTLPLGQRLMESVKAWLSTTISTGDPGGKFEAARTVLAAYAFRRRDEDTAITPESDADKKPRLVCVAADEGRTKPYAPIRNFRLDLTIRANATVAAGESDNFNVACGALETLLDGMNLKTQLTSATWKVNVMLAVREAGNLFAKEGDIRKQSYVLNVRAVGSEHTTA